MAKKSNKKDKPLIQLSIIKVDGTGLQDAYRLLSKKVLERRMVSCGQRSISG